MKKFYLLFFCLHFSFATMAQVHTTWLWHLQQPIYWPDRSMSDTNRYQMVTESYQLKNNGGNLYADGLNHPLNDLNTIFSKADRVSVYQQGTKNSLQQLLPYPEAGVQVNYSGCLMENINSLGAAGLWGYSSNWNSAIQTARLWTTSGGKARMDVTGFTFHHIIGPLVSESVLRKEIQAHKIIYNQYFGLSPNYSKGFWPAECSFSERMIRVLVEEGFDWSIVANSHLARTLQDYPLSYGTSGCNIDPPNKADVYPINGNNWWSGQIDGRGGQFAAPFCYQVHKARYVDPETAAVFQMDVVPMADLLSYRDGYAAQGTSDIDQFIAPYQNTSQPNLVLMAHDGDNAWGGGYSYYQQAVPNFAAAATSQGYIPTTIQQFINDHPVPATDIIHVEDGSWFNAANDWGHPQFINWLWPLYNSSYQFDPNGWTEDMRNWAVLIAAENFVQTAEDLSGGVIMTDVVNPVATSSWAEKAWHFLLPGFTSGYMYYGTALDMEVKQTIAANNAIDYALKAIAPYSFDTTAPNVFIPQRYPYNPGGEGFGPIYGYQAHQNSSDFHVWTMAYDLSGIATAMLKYRVDYDGYNPLLSHQNETYAGGNEVGSWQSVSMNKNIIPKNNITGNPDIDFFIIPHAIADLFSAQISGLNDTLVDYYVEVTDSFGNTQKTPIQHVWVGSNSGGSGTTYPHISWDPPYPTSNDSIHLIVHQATGPAKLHWGVNQWEQPDSAYWPAGTILFQGNGPAVQTPMNGPDSLGNLHAYLGPFNSNQQVNKLSFVISYNNGSWDNNNGADYYLYLNIPGNTTNSGPLTFKAYPNPLKRGELLQLQFENSDGRRIEIIDLQGKCRLRSYAHRTKTTLNLNQLGPGMYLLQITEKTSGNKSSKKLIIQN